MPVIHVTGTNGKGSTAQMITRLLMAHGLTVGTYTSPHLERINERLTRNGEPISDDDFAEQIAGDRRPRGAHRRAPDATSRPCTAAAFRWFADIAVDVAVVEVGLLGRWDATNVVDAAGRGRHQHRHGPHRVRRPDAGRHRPREGGHHQARQRGRDRRDRPELVDIFRAGGRGAAVSSRRRLRRPLDNRSPSADGSLDLRTPTTIYPDVFVPLHGAHQGDNAAVALTAVEAFFAAPLADRRGRRGLRQRRRCRAASRCSARSRSSIVDGAHNPPGADMLRPGVLRRLPTRGRRILVVGTLRDPAEMLAALRADEFDVVHRLHRAVAAWRAASATSPRAARELGCDEVLTRTTPSSEACALAMRTADADDAILATGSLYVAGAARPALRRLAE